MINDHEGLQEDIGRSAEANGTMVFWGGIGVFVLITMLSLAYGFQWHFGKGAQLAQYFRILTVPYLIVVIGLTLLASVKWERTVQLPGWSSLLGLALMTCSFTLTLFLRTKELHPVPWWLVASTVFALAAYSHKRWSARGSTLVYLFSALLLYAYLIPLKPMMASGGNMLASISYATNDFLSGKNPFMEVYWDVTTYEFMYLPGTWLPYTLFEAFGLDYRLFNLLALIGIVMIFEKGFYDRMNASILAIVFYPIILSHVLAKHVISGHVWPYWLMLLLTFVVLVRRRYFWAAVLFGLTLATRQGALFVVGPLAAYLYWQVGWKKAIGCSLICLLTYAVVVVPFSIPFGARFWKVVYLSTSSMAEELYLTANQVSASNYLHMLGVGQYLLYIQVIIVLAGSAVVFFGKNRTNPAWFLYVTGVIYLWLVLFNPYVVRYVYFPAFYLLALGICGEVGRAHSLAVARPHTMANDPLPPLLEKGADG